MNKDDVMYKYIEIITDYMKSRCDYALLLDGEWGSGKTFFVNNVLKDAIKDSVKIIHTSLYGKTSIEEINNEALWLAVFGNRKHRKYGQLLTKVMKEWKPGVTNVLSAVMATACDSVLDVRTLNEELKTDYLFVFDDIERCDSAALPVLIGEIHSQYTERGYHVLYIANEKQIKDDGWYKENKEKLIRHTIRFSYPELTDLLHSLVENRGEESPVLFLYRNASRAFDEFVSVVRDIRNIRTWMAAFDYYDTIIHKCKFEFEAHFCLQLFCVVLLTTFFCRENKSTLEEKYRNTDDIEAIAADKFHIQLLRGFEEYGRDFFYRFVYTDQLRFIRLDSIVSYINTGYCDAGEVKKEFEHYFLGASKAEKCRLRFFDYTILSQEELKDCLDGVYDGLFDSEYSLEGIVELSIDFELIDRLGYLDLFDGRYSGYRDVFNNAVENISRKQIGDYFAGDCFPDTRYSSYSGTLIDDALSKAYNRYRKSEESDNREAFEELFTNLGTYQVSELLCPDENGIIENAERYGLFPLILSFSCKDVSILNSYVRVLAENDENEELYRRELKSIVKLRAFLNEKLPGLENSKLKCDLAQLGRTVSAAVDKSNTDKD